MGMARRVYTRGAKLAHNDDVALVIPARLIAACRLTPERSRWLARLSERLEDVERRWTLVAGPPFDHDDVSCAWVAPVTRADGTRAVLKLGMPHFEAEHEMAGLRVWNGDPMVRLLDADESTGALLLERCEPGTSLRLQPEREQDEVIAGLLRRAWRNPPAPHPFRPLSALTAAWREETMEQKSDWPDRAIVDEGLRLLCELSSEAPDRVLLATDLHAGNVLRAQRGGWLAIDPKPFVGDPAYDATQHLLNCRARLHADPLGLIERVADLLDLAPERLGLWTFARLAADPRDDWRDGSLDLARRLAP
jgi:streptomycin 6-kinase